MISDRTLRNLTYIFCFVIFVCIILGFIASKFLTRVKHENLENLTEIHNHKIENIEFKTEDDIKISSWLIRNNTTRIIILLAGIRSNRESQLSRADFYLKNGFAVLMPDLRGTGKSEGRFISFGWHESKDLLSCIRGLINLGFTKISVDGQSLGAATILYSLPYYSDYEFIILESCYDNIVNAFNNRVYKYNLPNFIFIPVEIFTEKIIGISKENLNPVEFIKKVKCPILILAGDAEDQVLLSDTIRLFLNSGSAATKIHIFNGAKHENFHIKYKKEFENVVLNFIK